MNKLLALVIAAVVASPLLVACAGTDTPDQQDGTTKFQKKMTQAEADKLIADMNQAGPVCRRAVIDCSYSAPDADGIVVFEALIMCGNGGCPLLEQETGCP